MGDDECLCGICRAETVLSLMIRDRIRTSVMSVQDMQMLLGASQHGRLGDIM